MIATFARIGWQFESVLKRGLLEFALRAAGRRARSSATPTTR